jgi:REP element-mobilizing transposase RayT
MPRRLRLHLPGGFYHATLRGNHRQALFHVPADRALLDAIVARALERNDSEIHAYCWMTNHLHFFVRVGQTPLGALMRDIASNYARAFQRKLDTTGHLFERRYHSKLVDTDAYLLEVLRYTHLNPVAAGLVSQAAHYPWSSHRAYAGLAAPPQWLTMDACLAAFSANRAQAHMAYRHFAELDRVDDPFEALIASDSPFLGSDDFVARVMAPAQVEDPQRQTLADLIREACGRFDVLEGALVSASRESPLIRARAWIAHEATARRIASLSEVARALRRDRSTLRHAMRQYGSGAA